MNSTFHSMILAGALLALPAPTLAGCGGEEHPHDTKQSEEKQHTHEERDGHAYWFGHPGDPAKVTRTIKVTAMDIKFEPTELTVKAGETIRFEVTNTGKLQHEFTLGDQANQEEHEKEMQEMAEKMPGMSMEHNDPNMLSVQAGESKTLIWSFTKPGKLQYGCHVPGHYPAGMVGQLTVQ